MSKLWNTLSIIVGVSGFIWSMVLFGSVGAIGGITCLLSTLFSSVVLYSIGEYFYRNDKVQEMLLLIYHELKDEKQKKTSLQNSNQEADKIIPTSGNSDNARIIKPILNEKTMICPICNTSQPLGRRVCWECGTKFEIQ